MLSAGEMPRSFQLLLLEKGVSLTDLGLQESALLRADALRALEIIHDAQIAVLGGDVYHHHGDKIDVAYANWCIDRKHDETIAEFIERSWKCSSAYINRYPKSNDIEPLFSIVIDASQR